MLRWLCFSFFLCFNAYAQDLPIKLGNTQVLIHQENYGAGQTFIHVHHNETTALEAARIVAKHHGGKVITLVHSGGRNIVFHMDKHRYEFDPNRIFTDTGIRKTLSQFGPYNHRAHCEVKKLARALIAAIPDGKVIAVHNNQGYSLKDYFPGRSSAQEAEQIHVNPKKHYRNFYVVTRREDFQRLKKHHLNGVLQKKHPHDDGSLSVFLSHRCYVNVEAGYDQLKAQIAMLERA